ncbi:tc_p031c [Abalone herpesvirus Taiwan/2004]|uniref:Uncharacterized protein n=1 Tax=Abalone herpesvirus Taiwan/2005 TaxID=1821058 RepID=A0A145VV54_9VIRU|nr:tc_p031c [Abalone herpesvirus Taiwan/2004]AMW36227.1 hypothetical protein tc2005_p083c [Abalone herpesvirus Taiwan/2005]UCX57027.1 ORF36 [Haliotid herpesvirus 1]
MYTDATEEYLLDSTASFLFNELGINDKTAYEEKVVEEALFVFNTTPERDLAKAAYTYAKDCAHKARVSNKANGGMEDYFPQGGLAPTVLQDYVQGPNNLTESMVQVLSSYSDYTGVFGAIDILVNKTLFPFKLNNFVGTIETFYKNHVIPLIYPVKEVEPQFVGADFVKNALQTVTNFELLYNRLKESYQTTTLEGGRVLLRESSGKHYVIVNERRDEPFSVPTAAAWVVAQFVNRETLPKLENLKSLLSKFDYASVARDTIKVFEAHVPDSERRTQAQNKRFVDVLLLLSKLTTARKSYQDILNTMELVDAPDLTYLNERYEYKDSTVKIKLPSGETGLFCSVFKKGKRMRDVDTASVNLKNPFYLSSIVFGETDWNYTNEEIEFFFEDATNVNTNTVRNKEDMIAKILSKDTTLARNSSMSKFKSLYKNNPDFLPVDFFKDGYTKRVCVEKIEQKISDLRIQDAKPIEVDGLLYVINNGAVKAFSRNMDELPDSTHGQLADMVSKNLYNLLQTSPSLPLKVVTSSNQDFVKLCDALRGKSLPKIDQLRKSFDGNPLVENESLKEVFVDPQIEKNASYGLNGDFFPAKFEEDMNKSMKQDSNQLFRHNETFLFRGTFYQYDSKDNAFLDSQLNEELDKFRRGEDIDIPHIFFPAFVREVGIDSAYPFLLRNLGDVFDLYGYDITKYDQKVLVLTDDPDSAPSLLLKGWFTECFIKKPNCLDGATNTRTRTAITSKGVENKIPSLDKEGLSRLISVELDKSSVMYFVGDLPVLHVYKKASNSSLINTSTWQLSVGEALNLLDFRIKLVPRQDENRGDYYIAVVTYDEAVPKKYTSLYNFLSTTSLSGLVSQMKLTEGDTANLPSTYVREFFESAVKDVGWINAIPTLCYISYKQRKLMREEDPTRPPLSQRTPVSNLGLKGSPGGPVPLELYKTL